MADKIYPPDPRFSKRAHIQSLEQYRESYARSVTDPEAFWAEVAERITWFEQWNQVMKYDFVTADIEWFKGG